MPTARSAVMQEIEIAPLEPGRLTALLSAERLSRFDSVTVGARNLLDGHTVWNVNATAQGGGVAEMLQTLLAYVRGMRVDTRWLVLSAGPDFWCPRSGPATSSSCTTRRPPGWCIGFERPARGSCGDVISVVTHPMP